MVAPLEPSRRPRRFGSEAARRLLMQNALDDLDRVFYFGDRCVHQRRGRAVTQIKLGEAGGKTITAFVKLNWGRRRLVPRWTDMRRGQAFQSLPVREWEGLELFQSLGLLVPERLALLQRGWFWFQEAVIVRRVPPRFSLDEMLRNGDWRRLPYEDKQDLAESIIDVMHRIHRAGLGWRGTGTRHFFPERTPAGRWQLWLIDCEGVHRQATLRSMLRDYRKLHRSLEISGANRPTLELFQELTEAALRTPSSGRERPGAGRFSMSLDLEPRFKLTT